MRIIVTRPEADAADVIRRLHDLGHSAAAAPLLEMRTRRVDLPREGIQAVVATSRNALRSIADAGQHHALKTLPLFVVGPASESLARDLGFTTVTAGDRGARDLAPVIADACQRDDDPVLYLSGNDVAFDMETALRTAGLTVVRRVVYEAVAVRELPAEIVDDIRNGTAHAVMLMSPRTAKAFTQLAAAAGVNEQGRQLAHLCLSPAVAAAVQTDAGGTGPRVLVAAKPSLEEMLALVKELASNQP